MSDKAMVVELTQKIAALRSIRAAVSNYLELEEGIVLSYQVKPKARKEAAPTRPPHPLKGKKKSKAVIERMGPALRTRFGHGAAASAAPKKKTKGFSVEARKKIGDAVRARHARDKLAKEAAGLE